MSQWSSMIKEIGRGAHGARALDYPTAFALFDAILKGEVPSLELGAILIAYRIKGENTEELRAFADALQVHLPNWRSPSPRYRPVLLPCYNGTRKMANLLPLLAHTLAQAGVPVLLHGYTHNASGRHTVVPILEDLGYPVPSNLTQAYSQLATKNLSFVPIDLLSPALGQFLALREQLGVRHSGHTLAKCIDPFALQGGGVRVVSPTHPDYAERYSTLLMSQQAQGLLLKATEGEAFAHPSRVENWQVFELGVLSVLANSNNRDQPHSYPLPNPNPSDTAAWVKQMQAQPEQIPAALQQQITVCLRLAQMAY